MTDGSAISRHYLLYDFMQVAGGAERVTLTLAEAFPEFRTVVSRCYPQADPLLKASSARVHELRGGWSAWLPRILESMWCFRVRARCLRDAETVVYSGFYAPLAVHHQRQGRRIYYCHTVPRFAYDLYESTLAGFPAPLRPLYALFVRWFRWQYESAFRAYGLRSGELKQCAPAPAPLHWPGCGGGLSAGRRGAFPADG